jgi:hypothetical protein
MNAADEPYTEPGPNKIDLVRKNLVKLTNDAVTKVRRRVTWDLRDHRGRKIDPEWANRRRLLRARERLSEKNFTTMWNAITSQDDSAQILSA